jgi:hypothetical protein
MINSKVVYGPSNVANSRVEQRRAKGPAGEGLKSSPEGGVLAQCISSVWSPWRGIMRARDLEGRSGTAAVRLVTGSG